MPDQLRVMSITNNTNGVRFSPRVLLGAVLILGLVLITIVVDNDLRFSYHARAEAKPKGPWKPPPSHSGSHAKGLSRRRPRFPKASSFSSSRTIAALTDST
jgi:hypothetical protein